MKLAFTTLGCPEWSWVRIIDEAARLGYDGIELRGIEGEMFLPRTRPFLPENIEKTLAQLKERKLEIAALDTTCEFHDPESFDEAIDEGMASIDLACRIGSPFVRVFGDIVRKTADKEEVIGRIKSGITELCRYCEGKNVSVLLETHGDFSNPENLFPVLDGIKSAHFGLLWDIEHTYTVHGEGDSELFRRVSGYIRHTHIKDTRKTGDGFQLCLMGDGNVPVERDIGLLKAIGYTGYLSFEWEKKWYPRLEEPEVAIPGYAACMKKLLQL